jgi:hypothetical protein
LVTWKRIIVIAVRFAELGKALLNTFEHEPTLPQGQGGAPNVPVNGSTKTEHSHAAVTRRPSSVRIVSRFRF